MHPLNRQLIDEELFQKLLQDASNSPRRRVNRNFHELSEPYQRFLNVLTRETYIQVHRHKNPPKPETFLVLRGRLGFILFNEDGSIQEKHVLSSEGPVFGIDIQPGVYHTVVCLSQECICFEGKSGPYDPQTDKEFASWSPSPSDPKKNEYLEFLRNLF
ncbi:cupin domain protein, WbuC family [Leptospira inadai serovar Lyme str. 10]|uniref:Cupin domain protein, WbuC family n=2 Tax=Leptospira inadai serovar Lyme TaxID=293084 RepID=V6H8I8_9LEPT|nr:WbuC family cupin fold metalloprotein [Leptospira inadai]EQA35052.1 cupin domain protein, WbuC family [Leptospira inadai serovar Lyme str. 10]PNV75368.1 cupin fold metalloprotein, WbuC family [Leptospira inadai serovar Lyme]